MSVQSDQTLQNQASGSKYLKKIQTKAALLLEGILFPTQFPSFGIFINKKVGNQQNQDHLVYNF